MSILAATGHADGAPWIPIGVGVHTGVAFVGSVGSESHVDLTALGDTANIAARLASMAGSGEVLVTVEAADAAELEARGLERRDLALKGRSGPTSVRVIPASELARDAGS